MSFLLFLLFAGSAIGLEVAPLSIVGNSRYISYGLGPNESVIICNYTLGAGQAVSKVLWEILKDEAPAGTFEWKPSSPGIATGLLKDKVNLERDDSDLELTTLTYDLSANYSCTVIASDGSSASAEDEILIIDTTSRHIYHGGYPNEANCSLQASGSYYPVFPEPTVSAGLFSKELGKFYEKVPGFVRVFHANGSVGYSFNHTFQINEHTPADAYFSSSLGVRKSNGTTIGLAGFTSSIYFKHSCKNLTVWENQTVRYNSDRMTCYGEPYLYGLNVEAKVECADGYISSGNLTSVTLVCESANATYHEWIPGDEGLLPEDLSCVPHSPEPEPPGGPASTATSCYALLISMLLLCLHGR